MAKKALPPSCAAPRKRNRKNLIIFLLVGPLLYAVSLFCRAKTDNFTLACIQSHIPSSLKWNCPSPTCATEIDEALSQDYRYLASGGQSVAFVSQDNRYVIKFFKTHFHTFCPSSLPFIPQKSREKKKARALFKLQRDFNSYLIAATDLQEETGTLFVHLNKTDSLDKKLCISDKLGIKHKLELDRYEFAVQRRAQMAYDYIGDLIAKKELLRAKHAMSALFTLCERRAQKGYGDEDIRVDQNVGFLEERPLFIDIGRFVKDPSAQNTLALQKDLKVISNQLHAWLAKHYPQELSYFNDIL